MDVEHFKRQLLPSILNFSGSLSRWSKTKPMPKISCKKPTTSYGTGGKNCPISGTRKPSA